jgi:hypothetical protein
MISFPGAPLTPLRAEAGFTYSSPGAPSAGIGPSRLDLTKTAVAVPSPPRGARVVNPNYRPCLYILWGIFMKHLCLRP